MKYTNCLLFSLIALALLTGFSGGNEHGQLVTRPAQIKDSYQEQWIAPVYGTAMDVSANTI